MTPTEASEWLMGVIAESDRVTLVRPGVTLLPKGNTPEIGRLIIRTTDDAEWIVLVGELHPPGTHHWPPDEAPAEEEAAHA